MRTKMTAMLFIVTIFMTFEVSGMEWTELTLTIDEIESKRGGEMFVYVFLEDGFPLEHEKALKHYRFNVTRQTHQLIVDVPDAPFALKVHHDEDMSGTITKNWIGLYPVEGLGFSSGAKIGFGPPSFEEAVMHIPDDKKTRLPMIYP